MALRERVRKYRTLGIRDKDPVVINAPLGASCPSFTPEVRA
jgi:hypothetical protein